MASSTPRGPCLEFKISYKSFKLRFNFDQLQPQPNTEIVSSLFRSLAHHRTIVIRFINVLHLPTMLPFPPVVTLAVSVQPHRAPVRGCISHVTLGTSPNLSFIHRGSRSQ